MSEDPEPIKVNYCPYCGVELSETQEYCPGCGVKLSNGTIKQAPVRVEGPPVQQQMAPEMNPEQYFSSPAPQGFIAPPPDIRGIRCIHCKGTGFCKFCAGAGSVDNRQCPQCNGTGRCMICYGRGVL